MTISQTLNPINDNNYDDDITVTDVPSGQFLVVTSVSLPEGSSTREITVQLMPLEQAPGGTRNTNTGLYVRSSNETGVKVTLTDTNGKQIAENTTNYS